MSNDWSTRKQFIEVLGRRMAYVEMGSGPPVVFQHGNPMSSYLWRNILPAIAPKARCIALDLIGMGDSDKLPETGPHSYTLAEHQRYFDAALAALGVTDEVTFVLHDWGSALGFDWAARHPAQVAGLCYMEAIVREMTWDEWPEAARGIFQGFRSEAGEELVLEKNVFLERVMPKSILRQLDADEMAAYRAPFVQPGEGRRPMLTWPRQIPLEGSPPEVCAVVKAYSTWLATTDVPKLFINAEPGMILAGATRAFARTFRNQREVTVPGLHFIQEDSPNAIAGAILDWLAQRQDSIDRT